MTRVKQGLKSLNHYAGGLMLVSFIGVILPLLVLSGFGLYAIVQHGYVIHFAIALLISVLMVFVPRWLWSKRSSAEQVIEEGSEIFVAASTDWSDRELSIWEEVNQSIETKLSRASDWGVLKAHGFEIATEVAQAFGKKDLDFTVPEGLQLLEEISRRYRQVLNEHVPAVDMIKVSQIKWAYDVNDKYGEQAVKVGKRGLLAWRIFRAANPVAAVANEIRGKVLGTLTEKAAENLQQNAKRALLQEVAKVCIDLYSGRYTIEEQAVHVSRISEDDETRKAKPLEPVRVTIIGQLSSGKSSLVNALTKEINAEVDALPATNDIRVYRCSIDDEEQLNLIDMPGLDGNKKVTDNVLEQVTQSDLVLWVLKANQSSRQLDVDLQTQIEEFYSRKENISLKKPKIVGVLNQVDKLKPASDWAPPYSLDDETNPKVQTIKAAMEFNLSQLSIDAIYPLGMPEERQMFGIEQLETEIQNQCDHAKNVQLNRQRNEAKGAAGLMGQSRRLFKAGGKIVKNMI
ncbi:GTPase family protein [Vibrio nigripulchritudo]|uniref:GTPase family protein n=1 Tax=Vibrio nigripulchritudo TaxID=28173 RepID=UPI002493B8A6|nr:GTPase domain-containing protein [Vibrio nigripulchritudo]BDU36835.1 GTP-binding protein [Vibrio nigripulchritudo]BDU42545.1 GTP-binding protein [Vibrio nigripulchritudo]